MRLLVTGDAHLGRFPSRIPDAPAELSVGHVWMDAVDQAIKHNVDAVIFTGDMVDNKNNYFEAFGVLKTGISSLIDQHIPVYAVAGNHDYDVFPRLVEDLPDGSIHLLGPGGTWSRATLKSASGEEICLMGWSFPSSHHQQSPMESFPQHHGEMPTIGVVHGDLDGGHNAYAPLSSVALQQQPVAIWLLGHVHAPKWIPAPGAPILYTGSLQPLDPGEPGKHGPWLITVKPNTDVKANQLPLATVRYEQVSIDVSALTDTDQIESRLSQELQQRTDALSREFSALKCVVYRLVLTGRSRLYRELKKQPWTDLRQLQLESGKLRAVVDKITTNLRPDHDLEEISGFGDPPAVLAQWLLELKSQRSQEQLEGEALNAIAKVYQANAYAPLGRDEPDPDIAIKLLIEQGELLLDELMNQKAHE